MPPAGQKNSDRAKAHLKWAARYNESGHTHKAAAHFGRALEYDRRDRNVASSSANGQGQKFGMIEPSYADDMVRAGFAAGAGAALTAAGVASAVMPAVTDTVSRLGTGALDAAKGAGRQVMAAYTRYMSPGEEEEVLYKGEALDAGHTGKIPADTNDGLGSQVPNRTVSSAGREPKGGQNEEVIGGKTDGKQEDEQEGGPKVEEYVGKIEGPIEGKRPTKRREEPIKGRAVSNW